MIMSQSASLQPSSTPRPAINNYFYSLLLARAVQGRRREVGLSVKEAAELSGLEVSEWVALENGWVPTEDSTFHAIGDTIHVLWETLQFYGELARMSQEALHN